MHHQKQKNMNNFRNMQKVTPEVIERLEFILNELEKENCALEIKVELHEIEEKYDLYDCIFEENDKKGVKDIKGNVRVPAMYKDYSLRYAFHHLRKAPIPAENEDGKYALIKADGTGTPITSFEYDWISLVPFTSLFIAEKNGKEGLVSFEGEVIVPCELDSVSNGVPMNGLIELTNDNKYGLFDYKTGLYVKPIFDQLEENNDNVYVRLNDHWGYLDEEGNFIDEADVETWENCYLLNWLE